jgi:hypothetical protein
MDREDLNMVSRFLIAALLVVSAVTAVDMLVEQNPPDASDQSSVAQQQLSKHAGEKSIATGVAAFENPLARLAPDKFAVISERTLFSPTRRPKIEPKPPQQEVSAVPVTIAVQPPPLPDPNDFTLVGVAAANGQRIAMLRWNKTQEILRLRSGDDYTGWRIAEVNDRSVLVEQQGAVFSLKLFKGRTTAAPD